MDRDIWNWPYDEGESSYSMESGWLTDFYFGSGKDPVEENVMNVKSCIQVLKILIGKADDEIDELERDLLLLQCDLAWRKDSNQFEVYCTALREKINALDSSIKTLRQSDTDDQLPLPRQPAKKLCEFLKPLSGEGFQKDDANVIYHAPCQQDDQQREKETAVSVIDLTLLDNNYSFCHDVHTHILQLMRKSNSFVVLIPHIQKREKGRKNCIQNLITMILHLFHVIYYSWLPNCASDICMCMFSLYRERPTYYYCRIHFILYLSLRSRWKRWKVK